MFLAAPSKRTPACGFFGYATGILLCLWLALCVAAPSVAGEQEGQSYNTGELGDKAQLLFSIETTVDTTEGAEDEASPAAAAYYFTALTGREASAELARSAIAKRPQAYSPRAPPV